MMRLTAKVSRAMRYGLHSSVSVLKPPLEVEAPPLRLFSANINTFTPNPVAIEMIKYATSLAREKSTEESYARGLLILEQCESTQPVENSKGLVELARSTLLFESGSHEAAIERLGNLHDLSLSSISIKVAASEALVGIYLEQYREDAASAVVDLAMQILRSIKHEIGDGDGFEVLETRVKALKGLIELMCGNLEPAHSAFEGAEKERLFTGNAALSYGEFLHGIRKFSTAKEMYQKVIQVMSDIKDFGDPDNLGACNMTSKEVVIAAACALGQLEAHVGNFSDAEEILTTALKQMEEHFGPRHPKGLFQKAIQLLKAPPLEVEGTHENVIRKDIIALARGGYAETLVVQQPRKEGEILKCWAETAWGNQWMSLGEALEWSESSPKVPVIDTRICRVV